MKGEERGGVVKLTCRHPLPPRKTALKKPSLIRVNDKNVPELPEIEVFVDSILVIYKKIRENCKTYHPA